MNPGSNNRHTLAFIFITVLIDTIGFGIILPVTPELLMELGGGGLSDASRMGGWLLFAFAIMQFFFAPLIGALSDRYGRRPVLLLSLFAFGVDYLLMGFAPTLALLFVGRCIAGVAGAAYMTANACIADISEPENRAANFGLVGAAFGLGFIIGPVIGGLLGELGPRAPFFAAAALAGVNLLYGFFVFPETLPASERRAFDLSRANPAGALLQLGKYPSALGIAAALFLWTLAHQSLPSVWAFYTMFKFQWSEALVGASLAFAGALMAIVQGGLTRMWMPKLGEVRGAYLGLAGGVSGFLLYAFAPNSAIMYVGMVAAAFAGFVYPSMNALVSKQAPASAQGELQGALSSVYSVTSILGPPLMTQLFGYFSQPTAPIVFPGAAYACAALLTAACTAVFYFTKR